VNPAVKNLLGVTVVEGTALNLIGPQDPFFATPVPVIAFHLSSATAMNFLNPIKAHCIGNWV
jgi:hypothetical protein